MLAQRTGGFSLTKKAPELSFPPTRITYFTPSSDGGCIELYVRLRTPSMLENVCGEP
ncbi:hypothetical protein PM082_004611 [Marasmius tenuissimus]|nr:hypothetical protein PM082_004611 [Marasmius tenuissimus]